MSKEKIKQYQMDYFLLLSCYYTVPHPLTVMRGPPVGQTGEGLADTEPATPLTSDSECPVRRRSQGRHT